MKFNYQARNQEGELQIGTIEASSREIALDILSRQNLVVTDLETTGEMPAYAKKIKLFQKVTKKEVALFSRQLSIMFGSEVPLVESLRTLAAQMTNETFRSKIIAIANDVDGGTAFSKALASHPRIFSPLYTSMVRSGEVSGKLSESLEYLAEHLEREQLLTSKVKSSMMYPVFILFMFATAGIVIMVFVMPKLTAVLIETGAELPAITKLLIGASNFLRKSLWAFILLLAGAFFGARSFLRTNAGKVLLDRLSLRLPIIGGIVEKLTLSRFAENLSTLIAGGIPIAQALQITGDVVGNSIYKGIMYEAQEAVKKGLPISSVFMFKKRIPPLVTQMVKVGEKSGKLDYVLGNLSGFYRKEVDALVDNLVTLIEPILIVILGLAVALLVAAVLLPIYNIASGL